MEYIYDNWEKDFEPISMEVDEKLHNLIKEVQESLLDTMVDMQVGDEEFMVDSQYLYLTN